MGELKGPFPTAPPIQKVIKRQSLRYLESRKLKENKEALILYDLKTERSRLKRGNKCHIKTHIHRDSELPYGGITKRDPMDLSWTLGTRLGPANVFEFSILASRV